MQNFGHSDAHRKGREIHKERPIFEFKLGITFAHGTNSHLEEVELLEMYLTQCGGTRTQMGKWKWFFMGLTKDRETSVTVHAHGERFSRSGMVGWKSAFVNDQIFVCQGLHHT